MNGFGAFAFASAAGRTYRRPGHEDRTGLARAIVAQLEGEQHDWTGPHPADESAALCIDRLRRAAARGVSARQL